MTKPLVDDERHRVLRQGKHCGRSMCVRTLPDPDSWISHRLSNPAYDPECCCPCLTCHPPGFAYDNALRVVRECYGRTVAETMKTAREVALGAPVPERGAFE